MRRDTAPHRIALLTCTAIAIAVLGTRAVGDAAAAVRRQPPPRRVPVDSATLARQRAQLDSVLARREARRDSIRVALGWQRGCSNMPVVPGDTTRTHMPVAPGNAPRALERDVLRPVLPPCEAGRIEARGRLIPRTDSTGRRWWELLPAAGRGAPR